MIKYLIVFLLFTPVYADEMLVEVFDGQRLVAADRGEGVTITTLRFKMLKKGIDIANPKYRIEESNYTQAKNARKAARLSKYKGAERNAVLDLMIEDFLKRHPGVE